MRRIKYSLHVRSHACKDAFTQGGITNIPCFVLYKAGKPVATMSAISFGGGQGPNHVIEKLKELIAKKK